MKRLGQILLFVGLVFMILWFVSMRALSGALMPFVWVLLGLGVVCIAGAIFVDIRFFIELAGQRATKHGMNLGALVIIIAAILVGVNFVGFKHVKKFDYTKEKLHSLSDQTKSILKTLDSDFEVKAFFAENQPEAVGEKQKFKDVADLYQAESPKIKVTFFNPVKRPDEAKENGVTASGTVAIEYKGKKAKFEDLTEQGFTNAIIKLTRQKNKTVYFLTGHGELDVDSSEATGGTDFKKELTDASYEVKKLNFVEKTVVPDDAAILIIAGPKQAYFEPEVAAIKSYLAKGGKLVLALDPGTKSNLIGLAAQLGVEFKNNYVLDQLGQMVGGGKATVIGIVYSGTNDITKSFKENMTVFHLASQLKIAKTKPETVTVEEIVKSSPYSYAKPDVTQSEAKFVEGKDEKGPLTIVAEAKGKLTTEKAEPKDPTKDPTEAKGSDEFEAIITGNSSFLSNQLLGVQLNRDLAMNTVASLAKDKELVSISPKQASASQITITQAQSAILYYTLVFGFPIAIFFMGGTVWYRRRTA